MSLAIQWNELQKAAAKVGLERAASVTPRDLCWARRSRHPRGALLPELPEAYRAFISAVGGYPMFGLGYYDREGFSFLPPSPMEVLSVDLPGPDDVWPKPSATGPTPCRFAMFAGYDLSDVEGWAFGPRGRVWNVERGMATAPIGSFEEWLRPVLAHSLSRFEGADAEDLEFLREAVEAESDPHRLWDYGIAGWPRRERTDADRALHWVCEQAGNPYTYGLIDDEGVWKIPMGKRYRSVRAFAQGYAEVIPAESSYSGPWVCISPSGRQIPRPA